MEQLANKYPLKMCPMCKKQAGASVVRGYPTEEVGKLAKMGLIYLAGCMPPEAGEPDYKYRCNNCKHLWGAELEG